MELPGRVRPFLRVRRENGMGSRVGHNKVHSSLVLTSEAQCGDENHTLAGGSVVSSSSEKANLLYFLMLAPLT